MDPKVGCKRFSCIKHTSTRRNLKVPLDMQKWGRAFHGCPPFQPMLQQPSSPSWKDPAVSAEAVKRCKGFVAEPNIVTSLNADIRAAVFDVAVKSQGEEMFDELIKVHVF